MQWQSWVIHPDTHSLQVFPVIGRSNRALPERCEVDRGHHAEKSKGKAKSVILASALAPYPWIRGLASSSHSLVVRTVVTQPWSPQPDSDEPTHPGPVNYLTWALLLTTPTANHSTAVPHFFSQRVCSSCLTGSFSLGTIRSTPQGRMNK